MWCWKGADSGTVGSRRQAQSFARSLPLEARRPEVLLATNERADLTPGRYPVRVVAGWCGGVGHG
jgi:hypothetical protein